MSAIKPFYPLALAMCWGLFLRVLKGNSFMRQDPKSRKPAATAIPGPIKPDSPLYRALQLIAGEIANRIETTPPPVTKRRRRRE